jgi:hypothetical protein
LAQQLIAENVRNKYNKLIDKGILYKMLNNPVYTAAAQGRLLPRRTCWHHRSKDLG